MTDNSPWQAPGGSQPEPVPPLAPPTAAPVPPAAPFVPPIVPPAPVAPPAPFGAPGSAGYAYAATPVPGAAPGWTPPPKPGLIPLRPLTLGTMLGASFQVLRRNPRPMFGFSLLLTGGAYVLAFLVVGIFAFWGISRVTSATGEDADAIAAGGVAATLLGSLIPIAGSIAVLAILQGIVVLEVARGTLGEKLPLRGLLRAARGRIWALIGWSLLATAIVAVVLTIVVLLIVLIATLGGETIKITCSGKRKGCPLKSKTYKNVKKGTRTLTSLFGKKKKLKTGAKIVVTITKPGAIGSTATVTIGKRKKDPKIVRKTVKPA